MSELGWRWEALQIIAEMEKTRQTNNVAWMDVLKLVIAHAPTKDVERVLKTICTHDQRIHDLWKRLLEMFPEATSP